MNEVDLRRWHRKLGVVLFIFIIIQAGSGLVLTLTNFTSPGEQHGHGQPPSKGETEHEGEFEEAIDFVHFGPGYAMAVYRILLALGLLGMAFLGLAIASKVRRRSRNKT